MALINLNFFSHSLGLCSSATIILPQPKIPVKSTQKKPLPVLYLLHGLSDDHTTWVRRTSIERHADGKNLAVVMPNVHRSFYHDMAKGGKYWTFISSELPLLMQSMFTISARREDNFVAGLSMGGFGAFKLALNCPDKFAAGASLSGALDVNRVVFHHDLIPDNEMEGLFGSNPKIQGTINDLALSAKKVCRLKTCPPKLYQCCGTDDFLYKENVAFKNHLNAIGLPVTYEEGPGNHEWGYWDTQIQRVLQWLPLRNKKL